MASNSRETLPDIPSRPHQPTAFSFPKHCFGKKTVVHRTTMLQEQLNNLLLVLHVHKDCTDLLLTLRVYIATEFIGDSEHRLRIYGKYNFCVTHCTVNFASQIRPDATSANQTLKYFPGGEPPDPHTFTLHT